MSFCLAICAVGLLCGQDYAQKIKVPDTTDPSTREDYDYQDPVPPTTKPADNLNELVDSKSKALIKSVEVFIDPTVEQWWCQPAANPFSKSSENVTPEQLVMMALQNSPKIRAISREPMIRQFAVDVPRAQFDPEMFVETQFDDRNDPVGNLLTGPIGSPILKDQIWYGEAGFRKKFYTGGEIDVSQRLGFQNSDARFFDPQDQGTSTLSINLSQPLLRGRGRVYNRSQIVLAELDTNISWDKYVGELQIELEEIINAYWNLYFQRCVWLQKQKNVERGAAILKILENRRELDSLPSQIARARAAVMLRRTNLANSQRDIRDAETEIRRLLGMAQAVPSSVEMVPVESPNCVFVKQSMEEIAGQALNCRPEVKEAFSRAKIAALQNRVSQNELKPQLTALMGIYFSALKGDSGVFRALQAQYSETTPGYYAGLTFKYPLRNRAARSRLTQTQIRMARVQDEIEQISQTVIAESQVAVRRFESAYETLQSTAMAIEASREDLNLQYKRWESFALVEGDLADGQNPTVVLDQLLESQERLAAAELAFSRAQLEFKTAEISIRRVSGTLLQQQQIDFDHKCDGTPSIEPFKAESIEQAEDQ